MATRCEYCGQLYDGLSCPHCGAPRGAYEYKPDEPEWILTNSSRIEHKPDNWVSSITIDGGTITANDIAIDGDHNVVVMGSGNFVSTNDETVFYADNLPYHVGGGVAVTSHGRPPTDEEFDQIEDEMEREARSRRHKVTRVMVGVVVMVAIGVVGTCILTSMGVMPLFAVVISICVTVIFAAIVFC